MVTKKDIYEKSNIYSWSTKVDFMLNSQGQFSDFDNANVSLLWGQDLILSLYSREIHPELEGSGARGYRLIINAADTACEAEKIGLKLAYALLSVAIDKHWGMTLSWPDSPLPCRVVDRTASTGMSMQAFATVTNPVKISDFVDSLEKSFTEHNEVPYTLLLSMELYASSNFENNNRSKLIMLMSALEALAEQQDFSDELSPLIETLTKVVEDTTIKDQNLKRSLIGQVANLKRESIRRAITRLLAEVELSEEDQRFVDEAYKTRSKIVHEGQRVPELDIINSRLGQILKDIYVSI